MTVAVGAEQAQESTAKTGGAKFTRWGQAKHANREERDRSQQRGKVVGSERAQAVSTMVVYGSSPTASAEGLFLKVRSLSFKPALTVTADSGAASRYGGAVG
jgi:hypothetical protein